MISGELENKRLTFGSSSSRRSPAKNSHISTRQHLPPTVPCLRIDKHSLTRDHLSPGGVIWTRAWSVIRPHGILDPTAAPDDALLKHDKYVGHVGVLLFVCADDDDLGCWTAFRFDHVAGRLDLTG